MSEWRGSNRLFNGWLSSRLGGPLPADRSSVPNKPAVALASLVDQWVATGFLCSLAPAKRRALPEIENQMMASKIPRLGRKYTFKNIGENFEIKITAKWPKKAQLDAKTEATEDRSQNRAKHRYQASNFVMIILRYTWSKWD